MGGDTELRIISELHKRKIYLLQPGFKEEVVYGNHSQGVKKGVILRVGSHFWLASKKNKVVFGKELNIVKELEETGN